MQVINPLPPRPVGNNGGPPPFSCNKCGNKFPVPRLGRLGAQCPRCRDIIEPKAPD